MNNTRRKAIENVIEMISNARLALDELREEEEEYMNNIPENLTGSERYEKAEEACYEMEDIVSSLEEMEGRLEEVIS